MIEDQTILQFRFSLAVLQLIGWKSQ